MRRFGSGIWMAALPVVAAVHAIRAVPVHPLLTPDSPGYMYFTAGRPAGYPALLWLLAQLGDHYAAVRPAQILLYCAACWWLGLAARAYAASWLAAVLLQAALLFYPPPLQQADQIRADLPASAIATLFAASLLYLGAMPSLRRFLALPLLAGAGVTIRPDGLALAMAVLPAVWLVPAGAPRRRAALWGLTVIALCSAVSPAAHRLAGGGDQGQRLARGLIQKVLFLPPFPQSQTCDTALIDGEKAGMVEYWRQAPPAFQDVLRLRISNLLRYDVIIPNLAARHHAAGTQDIEPILLCYTALRARAQPWAVVWQAVTEYRNLVLNYTFVGAGWHQAYVEYLRDHPPPLPAQLPEQDGALWQRAVAGTGGRGAEMSALEHAQDTGLLAPPARNLVAVAAIDTIQAAACLVSIGFLLAFCRGRYRTGKWAAIVAPGCVVAMAMQLHLLAIAALEIAQPRYVFPLWPLMMVELFLAGCVARQVYGTRAIAGRQRSGDIVLTMPGEFQIVEDIGARQHTVPQAAAGAGLDPVGGQFRG